VARGFFPFYQSSIPLRISAAPRLCVEDGILTIVVCIVPQSGEADQGFRAVARIGVHRSLQDAAGIHIIAQNLERGFLKKGRNRAL